MQEDFAFIKTGLSPGGYIEKVVIKTNHHIKWDEATILRTNNNWHQRKILEAWEINCAKDPLNRDDGALLPKEYLHLTLANKKK